MILFSKGISFFVSFCSFCSLARAMLPGKVFDLAEYTKYHSSFLLSASSASILFALFSRLSSCVFNTSKSIPAFIPSLSSSKISVNLLAIHSFVTVSAFSEYRNLATSSALLLSLANILILSPCHSVAVVPIARRFVVPRKTVFFGLPPFTSCQGGSPKTFHPFMSKANEHFYSLRSLSCFPQNGLLFSRIERVAKYTREKNKPLDRDRTLILCFAAPPPMFRGLGVLARFLRGETSQWCKRLFGSFWAQQKEHIQGAISSSLCSCKSCFSCFLPLWARLCENARHRGNEGVRVSHPIIFAHFFSEFRKE